MKMNASRMGLRSLTVVGAMIGLTMPALAADYEASGTVILDPTRVSRAGDPKGNFGQWIRTNLALPSTLTIVPGDCLSGTVDFDKRLIMGDLPGGFFQVGTTEDLEKISIDTRDNPALVSTQQQASITLDIVSGTYVGPTPLTRTGGISHSGFLMGPSVDMVPAGQSLTVDGFSYNFCLQSGASFIARNLVIDFYAETLTVVADAPPVADAGQDAAAAVGEEVTLSGVLSTDDLTPSALLGYTWSVHSAPSGSTAAPAGVAAGLATFVPDMPGDYVLQLVVTDQGGQVSAPDTVALAAEIDPAFVFERLDAGQYAYQGLYDEDDNYWRYASVADYWQPSALRGGVVAGTKYQQTYNYESETGLYNYSYESAIGLLSSTGEQLLVSRGTSIPGTADGIFDYVYAPWFEGDSILFWGYGSGATSGWTHGTYSVTPSTSTVISAQVRPPVSIAGDESTLVQVWPVSYGGSGGEFQSQLYVGSDGSCSRTMTYTNYYGRTYSYCIYHRGLYRIINDVATKIADNRTEVPGATANSWFYGFWSGLTTRGGQDIYFIASWYDAATTRYRQGIFKADPQGNLTRELDDADSDWYRGWFGDLRSDGEDIFLGGYRYRYGYDGAAWWSSGERGIYRLKDGSVEPVATGNYHEGYDASSGRYAYADFGIDPYNFEVAPGIVTFRRWLYGYDSSTGSWDYDHGIFWKEGGVERRITPAYSAQVLGKTYEWIDMPWSSGRRLDGRSLLLQGYAWQYDSQYDAAARRYTYSSSSDIDVLIARFDTDRDGIGDDVDNCPNRPNPSQADSNGNGTGDPCEDSDADTVQDAVDNCPLQFNPAQEDGDGDGYGNACDVCPLASDDQTDLDGDGLGDACDDNSDGDTFADSLDNCPLVTNEDQANLDGDLLGDVCDPDVDGDGIANAVDGTWSGTQFTDESRVASSSFSDHQLGGRSHGQIASRGRLVILVEDASDESEGLTVSATNGSGKGLIKQCDFRGLEANLDVEQGTIATVTCSSIIVRSHAHVAQLLLDQDVAIFIPTEVEARVVDLGEGEFVVANDSEAPVPLQMNLGSGIAVTVPSGSAGQVSEPEPGQYEIQNRTESAQPITAEMNGVKYVFEPGDVGMPVEIDIKPGSASNSVNLGSNGVVSVAILGSDVFNATRVDPLSVSLASAPVRLKGKGTPMATVDDVNNDGRDDLLVHVETDALELESDATGAVLKGMTYDGLAIMGTDAVTVVQSSK